MNVICLIGLAQLATPATPPRDAVDTNAVWMIVLQHFDSIGRQPVTLAASLMATRRADGVTTLTPDQVGRLVHGAGPRRLCDAVCEKEPPRSVTILDLGVPVFHTADSVEVRARTTYWYPDRGGRPPGGDFHDYRFIVTRGDRGWVVAWHDNDRSGLRRHPSQRP